MGFAVYLNELERLLQEHAPYDVDVLLVYKPGDDLSNIAYLAGLLEKQGKTVRAQPEGPCSLTYRRKVGADGQDIE